MLSTLSRITRLGTIAALAVLLSACTTPTSTIQNSPMEPTASAGYPSGHIHGMSVDPGTNRILLATHDGLFDVTQTPAQYLQRSPQHTQLIARSVSG